MCFFMGDGMAMAQTGGFEMDEVSEKMVRKPDEPDRETMPQNNFALTGAVPVLLELRVAADSDLAGEACRTTAVWCQRDVGKHRGQASPADPAPDGVSRLGHPRLFH